jgi:hypothetical protein
LLEREHEVVAVLVGQRRDRNDDVGDVDALIVRNRSADLHFADDPVLVGFEHAQPNLPVVDQDAGARADRLEQFGMGQLNPPAASRLAVAVEDECAALFEHRPAAVEMADSKLGALKVEQDRRRPPELFLERADMIDQLRLLLLVAVAHVDPERVRAGKHQPADHLGVA